MSITIGQTVQVKKGQKDEDFETSLTGWSGRVIASYTEHGTVEIEWDSHTLLNLSDKHIRQSLDEGYDYFRYSIEPGALVVIAPKDTVQQVREIQDELEARYHDYELYGEPSLPFSKIEREAFKTDLLLPRSYAGWQEYLEKNFEFPFQVTVVEGNYKRGQEFDIISLDSYDEKYGIIAVIKWGDVSVGGFPLCDLEAIDKESSNYHTLRKYVIWFANR